MGPLLKIMYHKGGKCGKLALCIRNFLEGIDNTDFSTDQDGLCKTKWKAKIIDALYNVLSVSNPNAYGDYLFFKNQICTEYGGQMFPVYEAISSCLEVISG